jgi:uroporphyrinogen decarboxylase
MNSRELFLANANGEYTSKTPIWLMRQAGRFLPEYRKVREQYTFEALAKSPKDAAVVTAQPVDRFGFDAAIIFSDIMFVLEPIGIDLTFDPGPKLSPFLETPEQVDGYQRYKASEKLGFVADVICETRKVVGKEKAVLGFAGAPFTIFCYLCGLQGARGMDKVYHFMLNHPQAAHKVLDLLADVTIDYLKMQLDAGVDGVQIFDTWAGDLSCDEFKIWAKPYQAKIVKAIRAEGHLIIAYARNNYHLFDEICMLDASIYGLDWRVPLSYAKAAANGTPLQGNFNPHQLLGSATSVVAQTTTILNEMKDYSGYIFNLGHGILPNTPIENVQAMVDTVRNFDRA